MLIIAPLPEIFHYKLCRRWRSESATDPPTDCTEFITISRCTRHFIMPLNENLMIAPTASFFLQQKEGGPVVEALKSGDLWKIRNHSEAHLDRRPLLFPSLLWPTPQH